MVTVTEKNFGLNGKSALDLDGWLEHICINRSESDCQMLHRASEMAEQAHCGQQRASGMPYILHSLSVADILARLNLDSETVAAAILHDVIEDTEVTANEVASKISPGVCALVEGVTKMRHLPGWRSESETPDDKHLLHAENLRKMLLAMAEDVRVVLIKLADRVHNMRTLGALPEEKQKRIARETLEIVAPLANRLGIWQIKWELEDLSLKYLHRDKYLMIAQKLDERLLDRENYLNNFMEALRLELAKAGIKAEIRGRPKHLYSIWRKMERKQLDFERIFDVRAVRVIVDEVSQCYAALGIVHSLWPYVRGEFDDYITTPKGNNYRSLHTAVVGPEGKHVEVQIRTHEMHQHAELGVAAHWRYKEGSGQDASFDRKVAWLRQVLEWKEETADANDFIDQFKNDVLGDRVYVLSPAGKIFDLPQGATPIDFAYHVHSDVGHHCRGAEVDGRIVPLNYQLKNGEQIKIHTIKHGGPSRDWISPHLGYTKTARARSKIQAWYKQQNFDNNAADGRRMLDKELGRLNITDTNYDKLAQHFNFVHVNDFMAALGRGDIKLGQVVNYLQETLAPVVAPSLPLSAPSKHSGTGKGVQIQGVGDLLTRIAACCKPVPGDAIVGFITRGRGVTIHRADCPNALNHMEWQQERFIEVNWSENTRATYPVDIHISAFDRTGLLRDITSVVANEEINLIGANTHTDKRSNHADFILTIEIGDIQQLSRVLAKIGQLPNVLEARRRTSG